jgi:hypothetical protein
MIQRRNKRISLHFFMLMLSCSFIFARDVVRAAVGSAVQEGGDLWTCKVTFRESNGRFISLCSGSFESNSTFNLAGHCVEKLVNFPGYRTQIECPDRELFETQLTHIEIARNYQPNSGTDAAKIRFAQPITGVTILERASWKEIESWLGGTTRTAECKFGGYGFNDDCEFGCLKSAIIPKSMSLIYEANQGGIIGTSSKILSTNEACALASLPMNPNPLVEMRNYVALAGLDAVVLPGDSGGPLYCREDSKSPWKFVGVASSYEIPSRKNWTLVDDPSGKTRMDFIAGKNVPVKQIQISEKTFWVNSQRLDYEPLKAKPVK